jgi:hypothetical protein
VAAAPCTVTVVRVPGRAEVAIEPVREETPADVPP